MSTALVRNNVQVIGDHPTTLILAHGFGTDQTAWRHQQAVLAHHYRLVLFDHVGAGSADPAAYSPHRYRSLHSYAADLLEVLETLDVKQCVYVGHSMSGMIGLLAALQAPELFERMVFIGASPHYLNEPDYHGGFSQSDLDALYAAMSANYQSWVSGFAGLAMDNPERQELSAEFARSLAAIRPDIAQTVARVLFQSDHRADLAQLTTPTLVVATQYDMAVPISVSEYLAAQLPKAKLAIVNGRGHFPHMSAPDAVNAAICSFL